jgi:hypothetical protein
MANTRTLLSIWVNYACSEIKKMKKGLFLFLQLWLPLFLNVGA